MSPILKTFKEQLQMADPGLCQRGVCQTLANPSVFRNSWRPCHMHPRRGMLCGIISVAGDRRGQLTPCTGGQQWRRKRWRSNAFRLETPAALRRKVSALCTTHRLPAEMIPQSIQAGERNLLISVALGDPTGFANVWQSPAVAKPSGVCQPFRRYDWGQPLSMRRFVAP